ncbi:small multidrug resistance pump [Azospirillum lipoferum]|uniref:Multidrug efflux SMR transporter n=1 Tax=Azospirillum lipoferum TaxID=193 RepID=A0A5A9GLQ7_AZOLI|nr:MULTISPECIES: multidrug efflux SMR transporter [Azospirillum]KAA0595398.1 multidrug efflux SMR transporter [Azospirillum lipoferum]MCP1611702.1 small multidrug resistance pump [Azospirillum lipoferum]MDW5533539.1 multidrug efflux SMR transporter [Azospirillum sp. NL1]
MTAAVGYGLLALAILAEISATIALKASDGMTRIGPLAVVAAGYGLSFWLLSASLQRFPVSLVYSVWAGFGMAGAAIGGWCLFGERLDTQALMGMGLIALGVLILASAMGPPAA